MRWRKLLCRIFGHRWQTRYHKGNEDRPFLTCTRCMPLLDSNRVPWPHATTIREYATADYLPPKEGQPVTIYVTPEYLESALKLLASESGVPHD